MATPRAVELLSYFAGIAPVGEPVRFSRSEVMAALRLDRNTYHRCLNHLVAERHVRRIATRVLIVLRRPEESP